MEAGGKPYKYLSRRLVLHHPGMAASVFLAEHHQQSLSSTSPSSSSSSSSSYITLGWQHPSSQLSLSLILSARTEKEPGNGGGGIPEVFCQGEVPAEVPEVCKNRPVVENREFVPFFSELLSAFRLFVSTIALSNWGSSQKSPRESCTVCINHVNSMYPC